MLSLPLLDYGLRTRVMAEKPQVWDSIRKLWVVLTPEEHVRQLLITHLIKAMEYPASLMAVEKTVKVGEGLLQRFDLVVHGRNNHQPWMVAECKAPSIPISDATLHQLLRYHSSLKCRYWLITNGHEHACADAINFNTIKWMDKLPAYEL